MPRLRSPLLVLALLVSLLAASKSTVARAETRTFASAPEAFKLSHFGPMVFGTRATPTATAAGRASCVATFTGLQKVNVVMVPVILKLDLRVGPTRTVVASKTGAATITVEADVGVGNEVTCAVTLTTPYGQPAGAEGTVTASVPLDVQPPIVTKVYLQGATATTNLANREADYGPPGSTIIVDGKFLRNASVTVAGITVADAPTRFDDHLSFTVPANAPLGATQFVIQNSVSRTAVPFFVGIPAPTITSVAHERGVLTIGGTRFNPVVPRPRTPSRPVVKVGGVAYNVTWFTDWMLRVEVPDNTFGVVSVEASGGQVVGPVLRDQVLPVVASFVVTPGSLDYQGGVVQVTASVSDNVGVTSVVARITRPDGSVTGLPLRLSSGTAKLGDWTATFTQPVNMGSTALTYRFEATAADAAGNLGRRDGTTLTVGPRPPSSSPSLPKRPSI